MTSQLWEKPGGLLFLAVLAKDKCNDYKQPINDQGNWWSNSKRNFMGDV